MRKIIHCDADCFFAAVEMRDNPKLRGIPIAICGSTSRRGVVSTCNYEARRYGIYSAMPVWQAVSNCPDLKLIPHNMEKYQQVSRSITDIYRSYTKQIETVSIDEAYLDVSESDLFDGSATLLAADIRNRIFKETGITVSAGVAPNKFLAKVASEWRKPNGLFTIPPESIDVFMVDLPIKQIQGVGSKTAQRLNNMGVYSCGDLQTFTLGALIAKFGRFGNRLYELCRGRDERSVSTTSTRKSLSVEHTFPEDLCLPSECNLALRNLFDRLSTRLKSVQGSYEVKTLQAKVKFNNFSQTTIEMPSNTPLLERYTSLVTEGMEREKLPVRLLGIGVKFDCHTNSQLITRQLPLFREYYRI